MKDPSISCLNVLTCILKNDEIVLGAQSMKNITVNAINILTTCIIKMKELKSGSNVNQKKK